jgi:tetratricopeptide (TPR) repeat protein
MDLFGASPAGKVKKAARMLADGRSLIDKDIVSARTKLEESLSLLQSVPPETPNRTGTLTAVLLSLARLERLAGGRARAVRLLEQTIDLGAGLQDEDRNFLVIEYAKAGRTDSRAIDQYLAYVAFRILDPNAAPSGLVYDHLDACCRIDDATSPDEIPVRLSLCSRMIAADSRLGLPYFYRGAQSYNQGNFAAAMEDFQKAVERGVSKPALSYLMHMSSAYLRRAEGSLEPAANHFVAAAKQNTDSFVANYEAGAILVELIGKKAAPVSESSKTSKRALAISLLERACEIDSRSAEAIFALGRAYLLNRNPERAIPLLQRVAQLQPSSEHFYEYAAALRLNSSTAEAAAAAEKALEIEPGHVKAQWLASSLALQARNFDRAMDGFRRLTAGLPPNHPVHRNALYGSAVCRFETGDPAGAIALFEALQAQELELNPEGRLILARSLLRVGDLARAENLLAELVRGDASNRDAVYYLGCSRAKQGRFKEALRDFTAAEAAGFTPERCLVQRGQAHEALEQWAEARVCYERALHRAESPQVRLRAGIASLHLCQYEAALVHLRLGEQTPIALAVQAELSELSGDLSEANRLFRQALSAAPESADIRRRFALSLVRYREYGLAAEVIKGAVSASGPAAEIAYEFGLMRLIAGEPEQAIAAWTALGPSPKCEAALRVAALHAAKKAHAASDYDRSLAYWNLAARYGPEDHREMRNRAAAAAASAARGAVGGAPVDEWTSKLRIACELDQDHPQIAVFAAARDLTVGDPEKAHERLIRMAGSVPPNLGPIAEHLLGLSKLSIGRYAEALTHLRAGVCEGDKQQQSAAVLPYAHALAHAGRWSEAADLLGARSAG